MLGTTINIYNINMPEKKEWTEREDQVLKYLFDV